MVNYKEKCAHVAKKTAIPRWKLENTTEVQEPGQGNM